MNFPKRDRLGKFHIDKINKVKSAIDKAMRLPSEQVLLTSLLSIACFSIFSSLLLLVSVVEVTKKDAPKIAAANKIALIFIMYSFNMIVSFDS
jgi:hypothetical protein